MPIIHTDKAYRTSSSCLDSMYFELNKCLCGTRPSRSNLTMSLPFSNVLYAKALACFAKNILSYCNAIAPHILNKIWAHSILRANKNCFNFKKIIHNRSIESYMYNIIPYCSLTQVVTQTSCYMKIATGINYDCHVESFHTKCLISVVCSAYFIAKASHYI